MFIALLMADGFYLIALRRSLPLLVWQQRPDVILPVEAEPWFFIRLCRLSFMQGFLKSSSGFQSRILSTKLVV